MTAEQWLEAHGGPRRFTAKDTGDIFHLAQWLAPRGFELKYLHQRLTLKKAGQPGRAKNMTRLQAVEFVDRLRIKEGLQPISVTSIRP